MKRFRKLLVRDFHNIWPSFGLTMLIITLLPLFAWLLFLAFLPEFTILPEMRIGFILGSVWLAVIMAPSRLYKTCNLPKRGIYFAMLPASTLEKYLSMLLYSMFVCPFFVLVGGIAFDYLLAVLPFGPYTQWISQIGIPLIDGTNFVDAFSASCEEMGLNRNLFLFVMLSSYFLNASTFMFTNTIFKKHKVLKTILWLMLISFVIQMAFVPWLMRGLESNPEAILNSLYFHQPWSLYYCILALVFLGWTGLRLKKMKY